MEYVKNNEIVLNVGFEATTALKLGNEFIEFKARFGGMAREIVVPVDHVVAIYARENGQGMAFPVPTAAGAAAEAAPSGEPQPGRRSAGARAAAGQHRRADRGRPRAAPRACHPTSRPSRPARARRSSASSSPLLQSRQRVAPA